MASWINTVSLDILSVTSPVDVSKSKNVISCLSIASRYSPRMRAACLSPVTIQHDTSAGTQLNARSRAETLETTCTTWARSAAPNASTSSPMRNARNGIATPFATAATPPTAISAASSRSANVNSRRIGTLFAPPPPPPPAPAPPP
ncbi:Os02g0323300, partial [Oryza sativa Japonica Group]